MSAPTVRISEAAHRILKELAEQTGQTMMDVLDKALDAYRRKVFFEQLNAAYAALRADPAAWADVEEERTRPVGKSATKVVRCGRSQPRASGCSCLVVIRTPPLWTRCCPVSCFTGSV